MFSFRGKSNPYMLIVGMAGVKMGDRMLQVGCSDGGALAAIAAKVGLSGRAVAVVPDTASAARAQKGAERQGRAGRGRRGAANRPAVRRKRTSTWSSWTMPRGQFAATDAETRAAMVREAVRILKPGGRVLVVSTLPATGIAAMLSRGSSGPAFDATPALDAGGCRFVRLLGEREGLRFVEGMKARA